jgi:ABC-type bacteriocin/lantibiotic exporter with double-glycine peptidase domain
MIRPAITRLVLLMAFCVSSVAAEIPGVWLDVPFVKQEKNGCGAASVAMIIHFWQEQGGPKSAVRIEPRDVEGVLSPSTRGTYASDMEHFFQENGYRTFAFHGDWMDLRHHLEKGRPVIVSLRPGRNQPLHYVVIAGMDWERDLILINDPAQRKLLTEDRSRFEQEWNAASSWALLAVPVAH